MPKRSSSEAMQAVVSKADSGMQTHKSRSGRVVKPKVWDDGTVAAPVAALKDEPVEMIEREGDPDYSDDPVEEHLSDQMNEPEYELDSDDDDRYSDGPMGSYGSHGSRGRYGATRDENGKFTHGRSRGGRSKSHRSSAASTGGGGGIFKMAAVEVLRQEKRLLSTGEIARLALKRGLIKCSGKTPEATMASALYTDIKRREGQSIFIRPHEGLFGLREWIEQGVPFQDDYAEELAKRARANFGYMGNFGAMMPPVVDKEGKPIPAMPYSFPYGGTLPMGVPGLDPGMMSPVISPMQGLPPLPGYSGGKSKGRSKGTAAHGAEDDDEGLMQLLNAAEELHRSTSQQGGREFEGRPHRDSMVVDKPSSGSQEREDQEGACTTQEEEGAELRISQGEACTSSGDEEEGPSAHSQGPGSEGAVDLHPSAAAASELVAAAAAMAMVRSASAVPAPSSIPSEGGSRDDNNIVGEAAARAGAEKDGEEERTPDSEPLADEVAPNGAGALARLARLMQTPGIGQGGAAPPAFAYPPYYPHQFPPYYNSYQFPLPPRQPEAGRQDMDEETSEGDDADREAGMTLNLVVTGSAKPLQMQHAKQQQSLGGQEQVNIINLPLPDFEVGAGGPVSQLPQVSSDQLRQTEALVMRLESEMGTSHPEVGKALLTLAKLYMAEGSPRSRQLATAAISRAQDIMTVCQVALNRHTACGSAFAYLMDKAKSAQCVPRAVDITVAAGDAALIGLASPPPQQ